MKKFIFLFSLLFAMFFVLEVPSYAVESVRLEFDVYDYNPVDGSYIIDFSDANMYLYTLDDYSIFLNGIEVDYFSKISQYQYNVSSDDLDGTLNIGVEYYALFIPFDQSIYNQGFNIGRLEGLQEGLQQGLQEGYDTGYYEGLNSQDVNMGDMLRSLIVGLNAILNIKFGNITLGAILLIPFALMFVPKWLGIFKKGGVE